MGELTPDEAAIAEFHAAARRRQVRIFAIAALVCVAIGAVIVIVTLAAGEGIDQTSYAYGRGRAEVNEVKTLLAGAGFIVAGGAMAWNAYRIKRGARFG